MVPIVGDPDPNRICKSIVARNNLIIRMQDAPKKVHQYFSKRWEPMQRLLPTLHLLQLLPLHRTRRVIRAMVVGIAHHVWELRSCWGNFQPELIFLYTEIGFYRMAARNVPHKADLHTYYQNRIEPLKRGLLEVAESLLGEESIKQHHEFEDRIEKRLRNGAKFVPRKRQPR